MATNEQDIQKMFERMDAGSSAPVSQSASPDDFHSMFDRMDGQTKPDDFGTMFDRMDARKLSVVFNEDVDYSKDEVGPVQGFKPLDVTPLDTTGLPFFQRVAEGWRQMAGGTTQPRSTDPNSTPSLLLSLCLTLGVSLRCAN